MEAVTLTATVHVLKPATVMFVKEADAAPTVNEAGEGVPQPLYVTVVLESVTPAGRLSEKFTPVNDAVPGLLTVNVNVDVPPGLIVFGENDLIILALTILAKRVETP